MNMTEEQIAQWAKPPSETEDQKCLNAIQQATDAVRASFGNSVTIVRQGSHRNRTNIRVDSDVDIAVVHNGYYFPDISGLSQADKDRYHANSSSTDYTFAQFKNEVEQALRGAFGQASVARKNKCIRVAGNTNRVSADVVPAFEHRRFSSYGVIAAEGIEFIADDSARIVSFPDQHYANGVKKNTDTKQGYKSMVRILKRTRAHLIDTGKLAKDAISSHFIECLVWNVPSDYFAKNSWRSVADFVTSKIWNDMRDAALANDYAEVSDLHWLFRGGKRTPKQAEDFMLLAWTHLTR